MHQSATLGEYTQVILYVDVGGDTRKFGSRAIQLAGTRPPHLGVSPEFIFLYLTYLYLSTRARSVIVVVVDGNSRRLLVLLVYAYNVTLG